MQTPLQLTFRSVPRSDALATHIRQRAGKLDRIISCHVVVEFAGHHHRHGDQYRYTIHFGLPGHEVLVTHPPPGERDLRDAYVTLDRAFDEAERQLDHWVKGRRERRHDAAPVGGRPHN
jgi:ribosome-associated translation inhibitor RaiA